MESITSLGAGSGLDLAGLVDQLVDAERQSRQSRLVSNESRALSQLSAFGQIKGAVSAFQDGLEELQDLKNYRTRTASVAEEAGFTADANEQAATGRYAVEILALAESQKLRTDAFESATSSLGAGTLTISNSESSFAIALTEEASSLADIRDAINSASENTSVTAGIVNSVDGAHLVLTGTKTGEDAAFTIAVADSEGALNDLAFTNEATPSAFSVVQAATDAELRIDGLNISSATNLVTDAIEGVSLNLSAVTDGKTFDLAIEFDRESAKTQVEAFVQGYNNVLQTIGNQTTFNAETFQSGPLFGDSAVRSLVAEVRELISEIAGGDANSVRSLAEVGISTEVDGTLKIDDELLTNTLEASFDQVGSLFAGEEGMAARLNGLLGSYLDTDGRLTTRTDSLESRIDDFADQRDALNRRMESFEARIRRQFTSLDTLLSELNNTSSFLAQQLDSLPGSRSNP